MAKLVVLLAVALTADGLSSIETRVRQALFRYSGSLRPGAVLPPPPVPAHIVKPEREPKRVALIQPKHESIGEPFFESIQ